MQTYARNDARRHFPTLLHQGGQPPAHRRGVPWGHRAGWCFCSSGVKSVTYSLSSGVLNSFHAHTNTNCSAFQGQQHSQSKNYFISALAVPVLLVSHHPADFLTKHTLDFVRHRFRAGFAEMRPNQICTRSGPQSWRSGRSVLMQSLSYGQKSPVPSEHWRRTQQAGQVLAAHPLALNTDLILWLVSLA